MFCWSQECSSLSSISMSTGLHLQSLHSKRIISVFLQPRRRKLGLGKNDSGSMQQSRFALIRKNIFDETRTGEIGCVDWCQRETDLEQIHLPSSSLNIRILSLIKACISLRNVLEDKCCFVWLCSLLKLSFSSVVSLLQN